MIKIWRNLGGYRGDCSFESWVYRIAANCSLDMLRRNKRDRSVSIEPMTEQGFDPPDPAPGTEEAAVAATEKEEMRQWIAELPEEYINWVQSAIADPEATELPFHGLYNAQPTYLGSNLTTKENLDRIIKLSNKRASV